MFEKCLKDVYGAPWYTEKMKHEIAEVLTLTYFPPVLLFWHRRLQSKQCCCPGFGQRELAVAPEVEKLDIKAGAAMTMAQGRCPVMSCVDFVFVMRS